MKLEEQNTVLQEKIASLKKRTTSSLREDIAYSALLADKEFIDIQLENTQREKEKLEQELKYANSRVSMMEKLLDNSKNSAEDMQEKVGNLIQENQKNETTISNLKERLQKCEQEQISSRHELEILLASMDSIKLEHKNREDDLLREISQLNEKFKQISEQNNTTTLNEQLLDEMRRLSQEEERRLFDIIRQQEIREYRSQQKIHELSKDRRIDESDSHLQQEQNHDNNDNDTTTPPISARSNASDMSVVSTTKTTPRMYNVPSIVPSLEIVSAAAGSTSTGTQQRQQITSRRPNLSRASSTSSMVVSPRPLSHRLPQQQQQLLSWDLSPIIFQEHFRILFQSIRLQLAKEERYQAIAFLLWAFDAQAWYIECLEDDTSVDNWHSYISDKCKQFLDSHLLLADE